MIHHILAMNTEPNCKTLNFSLGILGTIIIAIIIHEKLYTFNVDIQTSIYCRYSLYSGITL